MWTVDEVRARLRKLPVALLRSLVEDARAVLQGTHDVLAAQAARDTLRVVHDLHPEWWA